MANTIKLLRGGKQVIAETTAGDSGRVSTRPLLRTGSPYQPGRTIPLAMCI